MKKNKFKHRPETCEKPWVWMERQIEGRQYKVKFLDVDDVCGRCPDLKNCQASIIVAVNKRIPKLKLNY